jgi:hypothetical protein
LHLLPQPGTSWAAYRIDHDKSGLVAVQDFDPANDRLESN